ncbi:MAG: protein-export chaperone SecB [Gammaproteobacteria bacterium]|nr:protein-export chaperone SecB [Gammaproteobacteria bacterium]
MADNNTTAAANEAAQQATTFDIRKIYLKDSSVESPNAPMIFLQEPSTPEISIDASIKSAALDPEDYYEVILGLTVTSKMADQTAFLVEVHQAGVFQVVGVSDADMPLALEIACPNILLPFAREAISDLVGKAGFPQLLLSPINFEALYLQKQQQQANAAQEEQH